MFKTDITKLMKHLFKILFFLSILLTQTYAQKSLTLLTPDFQANTNRGTALLQNIGLLNNTLSGYAISWRDARNGDTETFAQKYDSLGQMIGANYEVQSWGWNLQEIYNTDGSFNRIWLSNNTIYFRKFNSVGVPITELFSLGNNDFVNFSNFDVAVTEDGGMFLIWSAKKTNSSYRIYAQKFDSNLQSLGDYFIPIRSYVGGDFRHPQIKRLRNNRYAILYTQNVDGLYGTNNSAFLNIYDSTYVLNHDIRINDVQKNIWVYEGAFLGLDASDNIVAVFCSNDYNLHTQKFDPNGNKIYENIKSLTNLEYDPDRFQAAFADNGYILMVYEEKVTYKLYAQIINSDASKTNSNSILISDSKDTYFGPVFSNNCNFVIVLQDSNRLYQQAVDSTGKFIYKNEIPNDANGISGMQMLSNIGVINNKFLILWQDFSEGFGSSDIYGKLFTDNGVPVTNEKAIFYLPGDYSWSEYPRISYNYDRFTVSYTTFVSHPVIKFFDEKFDTIMDSVFYPSSGYASSGQNDVNDDNYFVAVFVDDLWDKPKIAFQTFKPNGSYFGQKVLVADNNLYSAIGYPNCAINNKGYVYIIWSGKLTGSNNIEILMKRYSPDLSEIGDVTVINDDGSSTVLNTQVQISMNHTTGNFVVTWRDNRNGDNDIFAQRFNSAGEKVGANFKVNEDENNSEQTEPTVSLDRDDNFVIAWSDFRNSTQDIYAQVYLSNGEAWGNNFRVNSDTLRVQKQPDAAFLDNKIYFSWTTSHVGGTGFNIFANVFEWDPTTEVITDGTELPKSFTLNAYPNPFNASTQITYTLPQAGKIKITLYNIQGKTVKILQNKAQSAGEYHLAFESNTYSSGVYFISLQANGKPVLTKKIVHLK